MPVCVEPAMGQPASNGLQRRYSFRQHRRFWLADGPSDGKKDLAFHLAAAGSGAGPAICLGKHARGISITILLSGDHVAAGDLVVGPESATFCPLVAGPG